MQLYARAPSIAVVHASFTPPESLLQLMLQALHRADRAVLSSVGVVEVTGSSPLIWGNPVLLEGAPCNVLADDFRCILGAITRGQIANDVGEVGFMRET